MKIEITPAELKLLRETADTLEGTLGGADEESGWDQWVKKYVKATERIMKRNKLPKRDFAK